MFKSVGGFSAIEMAIVLSVSAMIMGGGLAAAEPVVEKAQKQKTERQMERINDQLASYVHRNNRLPCPADPTATSNLGAEITSCTGADAVGIVPFRALGMKENDVRDSWGNLITYHVSPAFAVNQADVADTDHNQVHEFCRSEDWVDTVTEAVTDTPPPPLSYWTLKGSGSCGTNTISSPDGNVHYRGANNERIRYFGNSVGFGLLPGDNGGPGGHAIGQGEDIIVEFDHPAESFSIKLTDLDGEETTSLTFRVWEDSSDADSYEDVTVVLTAEWMAENLEEWHDGYAYFGFNQRDGDGNLLPNSLDLPDLNKINKVQIMTSNGPSEVMSYAAYGIRDIVYADTSTSSESVNLNPAKARFCCPMSHQVNYTPATDLRIVDEGGVPVVPQTRSSVSASYGDKDIEVPGSVASDIFVPAFALISHGPNAHGAFQSNSSGNRVSVSAVVGEGFGSDEAANSDGDNVYVYRMPDSSRDATYYDDIVMWRTQDQVYSEFGNQTCQTP